MSFFEDFKVGEATNTTVTISLQEYRTLLEERLISMHELKMAEEKASKYLTKFWELDAREKRLSEDVSMVMGFIREKGLMQEHQDYVKKIKGEKGNENSK